MSRPVRYATKRDYDAGEGREISPAEKKILPASPEKTSAKPREIDLDARYPKISAKVAQKRGLTTPKKTPKEGDQRGEVSNTPRSGPKATRGAAGTHSQARDDDDGQQDTTGNPQKPGGDNPTPASITNRPAGQPNPAEPLTDPKREAYCQFRAQGVDKWRSYQLAARNDVKKSTASTQASAWELRPEVTARIGYLTATAARELGADDIRQRYMRTLAEMMLPGSQTTPAERLKAGAEYARLAGWYGDAWKGDGTISPESLDPAAFTQTINKAAELYGSIEIFRLKLAEMMEKDGSFAQREEATCCDPAVYASCSPDSESRGHGEGEPGL